METHHHYTTVARAIEYLRNSHPLQPSLEQVAAHVHLSKYHFQRVFKEWAGVSPKEFLQYLSLKTAKEALRKGHSTLDTAYGTGLSGTGRLHDLFVKMEGCTPGDFKGRGKSLTFYLSALDTPFGPVAMAETERGVSRLYFGLIKQLESELRAEYPLAGITYDRLDNGRKVSGYFKNWNLPEQGIVLDLDGTEFQFQVWRALLNSRPGSLLSYGQLAEKVGKPGAYRAVGTAVGKNPVAYLIPCHRVILGNGEWGNYRWESERKMAINGFDHLLAG